MELQLCDQQVTVNNTKIDGYQLQLASVSLARLQSLMASFAVLKDSTVDAFFKTLEQAVENIIENYNLNH
ncbi:DUF2969 family protein [Streptococcus equi]|uniref:DUF2969 family protein n=1 Tax=Streptococcus equi TaxID=1336 RepID=UPI002F2B1FD0|nr:DUF2969 domain-containing protein [Streptococcus equi subsp. zooepidemicus]